MARTIAVEYIVKDEKGKELARFQDIEEAKKLGKRPGGMIMIHGQPYNSSAPEPIITAYPFCHAHHT